MVISFLFTMKNANLKKMYILYLLIFSSDAELTVNVYQTSKTIHNVVAKLYGGVEQGDLWLVWLVL